MCVCDCVIVYASVCTNRICACAFQRLPGAGGRGSSALCQAPFGCALCDQGKGFSADVWDSSVHHNLLLFFKSPLWVFITAVWVTLTCLWPHISGCKCMGLGWTWTFSYLHLWSHWHQDRPQTCPSSPESGPLMDRSLGLALCYSIYRL